MHAQNSTPLAAFQRPGPPLPPPIWAKLFMPEANGTGPTPLTNGHAERYFLAEVVSAELLLKKPVQERRWIVPDLIPSKDVSLLYGDGGGGKTLLALQLANEVRYELPLWLGMPMSATKVLFVTAEEPIDELHFRLAQINKDRKSKLGDHRKCDLLSLCEHPNPYLAIVDKGTGRVTPTRMLEQIRDRIAETGYDLVILEAAADFFAGNENDRTQVGGFIRLLRTIPQQTGCAVLLLAHPSMEGIRSGRITSGTTQWSNAVRSRMSLSMRLVGHGLKARVADPDERVLSLDKANRARAGHKVFLRYKDGLFVPFEAGADVEQEKHKLREAREMFLGQLRNFTEEGRHVSPRPGSNYAPTVFAKEREVRLAGIRKDLLADAMSILLRDNAVQIVEGPRKTQMLQIVEQQQTP